MQTVDGAMLPSSIVMLFPSLSTIAGGATLPHFGHFIVKIVIVNVVKRDELKMFLDRDM